MRKAIAVLSIVGIMSVPTAARANWRQDKCRYQSVEPGRWTEDEVRWTIRCGAEKFDVDESFALFIAERESGFNAKAENPWSHACGIFQHLPAYWPGRFQEFSSRHPELLRARSSCFNARSNILVALDMASRYGWGAWS